MIIASVPGKLILLGEHAAVYGRPALVAAVGLRLRATMAERQEGADGPAVRFRLPGSDLEACLSWRRVLDHGRRARDAWQRYAARPSPDTFAALASFATSLGPLHLLQVALAEAAREAGEEDPAALGSVDLTIASEIPVGSGFGSSAAASVAVILAYLAHRGVETDARRLHRTSLEVERRQHGSPSGVDNATVLYGGILEARRLGDGPDGGGAVAFEGVPVRSPLLDRLRVFGTGTPPEGTGTVVAAVRRLRDREPERVEALLDELGELTARLRAELALAEERPAEVLEIVRSAQGCLERLGVVPQPVRELVRRIEAHGGAAKISGAGSLAGPGAGNLVVYHPDPEAAGRWPFLRELPRHAVKLGVEGARLEPARPEARAPGLEDTEGVAP